MQQSTYISKKMQVAQAYSQKKSTQPFAVFDKNNVKQMQAYAKNKKRMNNVQMKMLKIIIFK